MNNYLVSFETLDKSFVVEEVANEADAINSAFDRLEKYYPMLFISRDQEYYRVKVDKLPHQDRCPAGHCVR